MQAGLLDLVLIERVAETRQALGVAAWGGYYTETGKYLHLNLLFILYGFKCSSRRARPPQSGEDLLITL